MTKAEQKFYDFIRKHIIIVFLGVVTIGGIFLRASGLGFESGDFKSFLNPWWIKIQASDVSGLANQVGNYNIPYQIIIFIMSRFPISALFAYKLLSVVFDLVLSVAAAKLVYELSGKKFLSAVAYALTFCSITVIFNSAFWAQCDSIYVSFILLALLFTLKDKPIPTFVMLGIALAFKLQTVFILPFFFCYYLLSRRISILHFLIIPAVDVLMCLPVVFLGRNPMDIITIYLDQTDYGKQIQMNCPNIYAFMCNGYDTANYDLLKSFSIFLTVTVLAIMIFYLWHKNADILEGKVFLLTAIWTTFTCLMFLSSMHERYGYLLDILLIVYALVYRSNIWTAVVCSLVSLRGYCYYFFVYEVIDIRWTSLAFIAAYVWVTYTLIKETAGGARQKTITR